MDSIDSQIIVKELMKGPDERGREDFENAISDDLDTQNFQKFSRSVPTMVAPHRHRVL
jgi:hypothetical protein